jgi:hypothetical protein
MFSGPGPLPTRFVALSPRVNYRVVAQDGNARTPDRWDDD